jgi:hypothetical protein
MRPIVISTLLFFSYLLHAAAENGASIRVTSSTHFEVLTLKKGQPRLYNSNPMRVIEDFDRELQPGQFMSIPQRLEMKLEVQVEKSGRLIALFGGNDAKPVPADKVFIKNSPERWKLVNGVIKGKNIIACFETIVLPGEALSLEGFELQLAAGSIESVDAATSKKPVIESVDAATSKKPVETIQTDANQPRIEVIKDQGPNATEWALTPLEEAIPGGIRQNLTYLREDLLDEAKKSPKGSTDAYALASDYCDKILKALDQRDLARVNAGYTAAQADASISVTSQALSARRNSQMSWPQYAREKDQRNESFRQQTAGADVKKERIKVEWASRSVQMRSYLDDLYTKLRAALR